MVTWGICAAWLVCALLPTVNAAPADPDNAALLYYQAFLLCPDASSIPSKAFRIVFRGAGSVDEVREYVEDYQNPIKLAEAASKIPQCNWAIPYSQGSEVRTKLEQQIKTLSFLIGADARVLAANGDYTAGLARCLMLRRFAKHLADDPDNQHSNTVEANALSCMRCILDTMPPDEETLKSLKYQFAAEPKVAEPLSTQIKRGFEQNILAIRTKGRVLPWLRQELAEKAANDKLKKEALSLTNAELLRLIREPYAEFIDSVLDTLARDMPYEQTYVRIEILSKELIEKAEDDPAITLSAEYDAETMPRRYSRHFAHKAHINAVKVAIEIYLLKSTTGRLPDALPNGLPKDPFSGKDFEYEITKDGFVLRCRGKDINASKKNYWPGKAPVSEFFWQYEFKVKSKE